MNELELTRTLSKALKHSPVNFLGVFPSDHIPCVDFISAHTPCNYVVNTDPCTESGTHWVAFFHPSPGLVEFFDSFGKHPSYYHFPIPSNMKLKFNHYTIQSNNSSACGKWCILFLIQRAQGHSRISITRRLSSLTSKHSEALVKSYHSDLLNHIRKQ